MSQNNSKDATKPQVPSFPDDPKAVNAMAARELNEMTVNDREMIYEEINCIAHVPNEEPELVNKSQNDLQDALDRIRSKEAYDMALSQSPNYVSGDKLRLKFLRASFFDPQDAASRMVGYFENKRLFFGDQSLGRPIRYADLFVDDIKLLKTGWFQVLPFRDKGGRAIVWHYSQVFPDRTAFSCMRAMWYFYELLAQDEETQKTGYVFYSCGPGVGFSRAAREFVWHSSRLGTYFPIRTVCAHLTIENPLFMKVVSLAQLAGSKDTRARLRVHCGTQTEWMYSVMAFGIPMDHIPITNTGKIKTKYFKQWLAHRHSLEVGDSNSIVNDDSTAEEETLINLPRWNDILLGKGSLQNKYSGNQLFLQVVLEYSNEFKNAQTRQQRKDIATKVWMTLQAENARFLNRHKDGCNWVELVDEDEIIFKIIYQLRTKKPPVNKSRPPPPSKDKVVGRDDDVDVAGVTPDDPSAIFLDQVAHGGCIDECFCAPPSKRTRF